MKEFKKKGKLRTQKCFSDAVTFQLMKHTQLIAIKKKKKAILLNAYYRVCEKESFGTVF